MGWGHPHFGAYAKRVVEALKYERLESGVLVLQNDVELAAHLRAALPRAMIVHLSQNDLVIAEKYRRKFTASVDVPLAVSDYCARYSGAYFGIPVGTLYNGVNPTTFAPAAEIVRGPPIINFVGRMQSVKGPDLLLRAALALARKGLRFGIQMLGTKHFDRHEVDEFNRSLSLAAGELQSMGIAVRMAGHVPRAGLPAELCRAQINCVPSRWREPFGLTTLEGMACGLATVASNTGGTPEVVGDAGLLFERENVEQLAGHLERLITDENLRRDYAVRARQRALNFTWAKTWTSLFGAINGEAAGGRRGVDGA